MSHFRYQGKPGENFLFSGRSDSVQEDHNNNSEDPYVSTKVLEKFQRAL